LYDFLACTGGFGFSQIPGAFVKGGIAGRDSRDSESDGQMAFAYPGRSDKEHPLGLRDKSCRGQVKYQLLWYLGIKAKVKGVDSLFLRQPRSLDASGKEAVSSSIQLIFNEELHELDVGKIAGDRLLVSHRQDLGNAGEAQML
jgi:hypothetical protein